MSTRTMELEHTITSLKEENKKLVDEIIDLKVSIIRLGKNYDERIKKQKESLERKSLIRRTSKVK